MVKPVIFQISGYQNSRKTTMMKALIIELTKCNFKVSTIKHHGHGGKPDITEEKDSNSHISAGAIASLVEGEGRVIVQAEKSSWSLQEQIEIISRFGSDFILIEGHKLADFPKAVLLRGFEDAELLKELSNIQVIFSHTKELAEQLKKEYSIPVFTFNDEAGFKWITEFLKSQWNIIK